MSLKDLIDRIFLIPSSTLKVPFLVVDVPSYRLDRLSFELFSAEDEVVYVYPCVKSCISMSPISGTAGTTTVVLALDEGLLPEDDLEDEVPVSCASKDVSIIRNTPRITAAINNLFFMTFVFWFQLFFLEQM